jgi:hypothetical protein
MLGNKFVIKYAKSVVGRVIREYFGGDGMGFALLIVGVIQLIRRYRLEKNEAYREKMEIEVNDERNKII